MSHPNVMPVLDADPDGRWFIMPLANGSAASHADRLRETRRLRGLVEAVCEGLRQPHADGWIHRDIKPANILLLQGRWVVADWGLGRRPRGQTSVPRRTRTGTGFGSEGFAAPDDVRQPPRLDARYRHLQHRTAHRRHPDRAASGDEHPAAPGVRSMAGRRSGGNPTATRRTGRRTWTSSSAFSRTSRSCLQSPPHRQPGSEPGPPRPKGSGRR